VRDSTLREGPSHRPVSPLPLLTEIGARDQAQKSMRRRSEREVPDLTKY
jgi:hypothetical protein